MKPKLDESPLFVESLAHELDLTTRLSVLDDMWMVYIDRIRNRAIVGVLLGIGDRIIGRAMTAESAHS